MSFIYFTLTFKNYGFALIIFTILTRLAMLPLTIKQYQSTAKMQKLNPRLEELRRQFGTDKKRLQEETMKLYQEEKVNPAGGCLPLLIQFPILFSLYPVITRPLRYMLEKTQEQITALNELYVSLSGNAARFVQEMEILNFFKNDPSSMAKAEAAGLLRPTDLINVKFIGLDLSKVPTYSPDILFGEQSAIYLPLLLIPIIGVVSTYISGKISMASNAAQSAQNQQAASMNKSMQLIGPIMTLIFSFQLPAGVLVYWIAGYIIQIVQQLFINKYVLKLDNVLTGAKAAIIGAKGAGGGNAAQAGGNAAGTGGGGGAKAIAGDADEPSYMGGGGSLANRITGFAGSLGVSRVNTGKQGGIVHGGEFKPAVRIPGLTYSPAEEEFGEGDVSGYGSGNGSGDGGAGGQDGGQGAGEEAGGAGNAGGVSRTDGVSRAGGAVGGADKAGARRADAAKAQADAKPAGDGKTADGGKPAGGNAAAARSHNVDTRSNTKKNYGSQKRKKKK